MYKGLCELRKSFSNQIKLVDRIEKLYLTKNVSKMFKNFEQYKKSNTWHTNKKLTREWKNTGKNTEKTTRKRYKIEKTKDTQFILGWLRVFGVP